MAATRIKLILIQIESVLINLLVSRVSTHLTHEILQHHILLEQVVDGDFFLGVVVHRALEEEAQETLRAPAASTVSQVDEQAQVKA